MVDRTARSSASCAACQTASDARGPTGGLLVELTRLARFGVTGPETVDGRRVQSFGVIKPSG